MLHQLQGHHVGGRRLRDAQHVMRGEHTLIGHQRHGRPGPDARYALDAPRRQRCSTNLMPISANAGSKRMRQRLHWRRGAPRSDHQRQCPSGDVMCRWDEETSPDEPSGKAKPNGTAKPMPDNELVEWWKPDWQDQFR
jgi:hypothetical protein